MKILFFIKKHVLTVVVFIVIVFIGLIINWARATSSDAIIESTFDELDQIGKQHQLQLTNLLNETTDDLSLFAEFIVKNNVDSEDIVDYMKHQSQSAEFDNLHYIDLDGNGVSIDNKHHDFSENTAFLSALENEKIFKTPHISSQTKNIVFDLAVPVVKDGESIAVLFCEISISDFISVFIQNKNDQTDFFFVDSELNMFFSTSDNHINTVAIPEEDVIEMGVDNVTEAQHNIQNQQNGGFHYDYFGTPKIMVYYPIESTNVALAMNVHIDSLSSETINAIQNFDLVGSIIYWTVILLVFYIAFMHSRSTKRITKVAYYDSLTKLPNIEKLKLDMKTVLQGNQKNYYTILIADIENFKAINEIFGYDMGDRVLKTVKTLADSFNEPSLITARIGSDKFAMFASRSMLDDLSFFSTAVTTHYDEQIPELINYSGTFKLGRYHIELGETDVDDILAKANLAYNKAKSIKGISYCDYDETFKKTMQAEAEITNKMQLALINKEFKAYLQPKFSILDNKLIGSEALVRWIDSDGNIRIPRDFIPLFERNGFIVDLDRFVLEQVCKTIKQWLDEDIEFLPISVNCSRLNLQNQRFVSDIVAIVDKYNVPHKYIEIELTESAAIESEQSIEQLFADLHKEGFKISIDDFGAGHSSLGMLKNLQVDTLKMDRSFFVSDNNVHHHDMLIDSIIKMAHNLNMYVVAEGIETADQIKLLKSLNCDAVQGYFYDKPMPIEQFVEKYCRGNRF